MATGEGSLRPAAPPAAMDWQWRTRDFIVAAALAVPLGLVWSFAYIRDLRSREERDDATESSVAEFELRTQDLEEG